MEQVVRARDLTKTYRGQTAVRDLSLDIPPGRIVGVVGPSGSGKTTTVRMLLGAEAPSDGEVLVFGDPPSTFGPEQRRRIGYMPQLSVLYPHLSLQENLHFVASLYGLPLRRRRRLREVLALVELTEHRRKKLSQTSGGMQRRLALAAALLHKPDLLFLDEPTAGIGPIQRRTFWEHFTVLKEAGRTLVITTQYVGEAAYCDLVALLVDGRLVAFDHPDALRHRALGGDVVTLTAAQPVPPSVVGELQELPLVREAARAGEDGRGLRIVVDEADTAIPRLQDWFARRDIRPESIGQHLPPFEDVFVNLVEQASRA
ncbi:MAG TPA: ABC transporter ATP-binding protein [Egibacteraceae bacterium]|nr:ABC transporter ATP-binding protein [Egibacteraceae bacterium]